MLQLEHLAWAIPGGNEIIKDITLRLDAGRRAAGPGSQRLAPVKAAKASAKVSFTSKGGA